jgi:flagellar basal-body rod modification protein FlgD
MESAAISASVSGIPASAAGSADAKLADNFDTFLTLLTTQLQHQDPLDPMDANVFTEQLVQFSQVEQSIQSNKYLEQLLAMVATNSTADAVSYLGKSVEANGKTTLLANGKADWRYQLPENAESTTITITNDAGKLVYATQGKLEAGSHDYSWNGKDSTGNTLPDGAYTIAISSYNDQDVGIMVDTFVTGTVNSIRSDESGVVLMLDEVSVPATSVVKVSEPDDILPDS